MKSTMSLRRPGDQQFQMAHRLRLELAAEAKPPQPAAGAAEPAVAANTPVAALLAVLQACFSAPQPQVSSPSVAPARPRDTTPGEGWTLPERRKFRFRLEDVAFE